MSFKVNDRVVYPHHGAAVIKKKVKRELQGETREYFVLEMVHGDLMLSVPVDMAEEVGMRPPISKSDVDDLFRLIAKRDVREPANWSRRFKNHQEKMKSGDVYRWPRWSGTWRCARPARASPPPRSRCWSGPGGSWCRS